MRKIEAQAVQALATGRNFKSSNTEVRWTGPSVAQVFLHGNEIASLVATEAGRVFRLHWGDSRWYSRTTFSRQNALMLGMGIKARVHTIQHRPMLTTDSFPMALTGMDSYSWRI